MDDPMTSETESESGAMPSPEGVAKACESAVLAAATAGLDIVGAVRIVLEFDADGSVTVTASGADGVESSSVVSASDVATMGASDTIPPPPPPA
ncbi:hypothetical protein D4Q85_01135 [bacterium]|nr:MAG: hypothetical protein D4Q85_01135 [bacterium]